MCNKKYLIRLGLLGLIFSVAAIFIFQGIVGKENKNFEGNEIREVKIGKSIFQAEIVATAAKRNQGLSGRKELCEKCAMLFLFDEKKVHSFWMKEMNFDLDIIWIDNNEIVYIARNTSREKKLEVIRPNFEVDKVLEINAGLADSLGIKTGDRIGF